MSTTKNSVATDNRIPESGETAEHAGDEQHDQNFAGAESSHVESVAARDEVPIFLGDQIFVRDAARSFSVLEQSVRERATAAGVDDVEGVTRRTMHRLMMFARCVVEVDGAKGYWLEVDREDRSFEAGRSAVPALDRKHPVCT